MDTQDFLILFSQLLCVFATLYKLTLLPLKKKEKTNKQKNLDSPAVEQGSLCLKWVTPFTNCVNMEKSSHLSDPQFLLL